MCVCVCASAFVLDYVSAWAKLHKPESSERQQLFLGQQKKENSCRSSGNYKNLSTLPTDQQSLVIMQSHCLQLSITIPLLFLLLALQQTHSQNAGFNYCQPGLCPLMKKHIACRNNGVSNEGSSFCKLELISTSSHRSWPRSVQRMPLCWTLLSIRKPFSISTISCAISSPLAKWSTSWCPTRWPPCNGAMSWSSWPHWMSSSVYWSTIVTIHQLIVTRDRTWHCKTWVLPLRCLMLIWSRTTSITGGTSRRMWHRRKSTVFPLMWSLSSGFNQQWSLCFSYYFFPSPNLDRSATLLSLQRTTTHTLDVLRSSIPKAPWTTF